MAEHVTKLQALTNRNQSELKLNVDLTAQVEDLKMDLHKHQLSKIKMTSKHEESRKRQTFAEAELKKTQHKLKDSL